MLLLKIMNFLNQFKDLMLLTQNILMLYLLDHNLMLLIHILMFCLLNHNLKLFLLHHHRSYNVLLLLMRNRTINKYNLTKMKLFNLLNKNILVYKFL